MPLALLLTAPFWPFKSYGDNLHTAVPGELYRSAQLRASKLEETIQKNGIASVLNLRGGTPGQKFYDEERLACWRQGAVFADVPMSATRLPTPEEIESLVATLDRLPKPILVHCQAGKDRTGLAITVYLAIVKQIPIKEAKSNGLSKRYGHTGHSKAAAMDRFVDLYREDPQGLDFRTWIENVYPSIYPKVKRPADTPKTPRAE